MALLSPAKSTPESPGGQAAKESQRKGDFISMDEAKKRYNEIIGESLWISSDADDKCVKDECRNTLKKLFKAMQMYGPPKSYSRGMLLMREDGIKYERYINELVVIKKAMEEGEFASALDWIGVLISENGNAMEDSGAYSALYMILGGGLKEESPVYAAYWGEWSCLILEPDRARDAFLKCLEGFLLIKDAKYHTECRKVIAMDTLQPGFTFDYNDKELRERFTDGAHWFNMKDGSRQERCDYRHALAFSLKQLEEGILTAEEILGREQNS